MLKLYCSSEYMPDTEIQGRRWPILQNCNVGFGKVMYLMWLLKGQGVECEIIDTALLSEHEIKQVYMSIIPLAEAKKHSIRRVFGTKHQSGIRFGVQVPTLLVYGGVEHNLIDVYPRMEGRLDYVTIRDYLITLILRTGITIGQRVIRTTPIVKRRRSER